MKNLFYSFLAIGSVVGWSMGWWGWVPTLIFVGLAWADAAEQRQERMLDDLAAIRKSLRPVEHDYRGL